MRDPGAEINLAVSAIRSLVPDTLNEIAKTCAEALRGGHKIFFCGNGGSASQASHLAAEFVGRFERERKGWSAIALTVDTAAITAIANDYAFDRVFQRQLEALGTVGDVLFCLSTSGRSSNVVRVARYAKVIGIKTIAFVGNDANALADCDFVVKVASRQTSHVQEAHLTAGHIICGLVERLVDA